MSIESDLRKDGIEVISQLDTLTVNGLARNIASRLCSTFPDFGLDEKDLFMKLSRLNMYFAKMPEGMAEANYFYKNESIYFNEHIPEEDIEEFAIHECIHHIQEVKDKKNYLRITFDDFTPNATNTFYRDHVLEIKIICHFDDWDLDNFELRPYRIAGEIDSMLDG